MTMFDSVLIAVCLIVQNGSVGMEKALNNKETAICKVGTGPGQEHNMVLEETKRNELWVEQAKKAIKFE